MRWSVEWIILQSCQFIDWWLCCRKPVFILKNVHKVCSTEKGAIAKTNTRPPDNSNIDKDFTITYFMQAWDDKSGFSHTLPSFPLSSKTGTAFLTSVAVFKDSNGLALAAACFCCLFKSLSLWSISLSDASRLFLCLSPLCNPRRRSLLLSLSLLCSACSLPLLLSESFLCWWFLLALSLLSPSKASVSGPQRAYLLPFMSWSALGVSLDRFLLLFLSSLVSPLLRTSPLWDSDPKPSDGTAFPPLLAAAAAFSAASNSLTLAIDMKVTTTFSPAAFSVTRAGASAPENPATASGSLLQTHGTDYQKYFCQCFGHFPGPFLFEDSQTISTRYSKWQGCHVKCFVDK